MLKLSNIRAARKAAKKTLQDAGTAINAHKDRISRIEKGEGLAKITELEDLCRLYGFNICLLTDAEYAIMCGIVPFLAKNRGKEGEKGE
jgi:transcriptional regulator with XRE-family HTH domain